MTSWRKSRGNGFKAEIFNTKSHEEIKTSEILSESFPKGKPEIFGIIGGPPCQDFSVYGSNKGFTGKRGKQTTLFIKRILEIQPSFFVMENVPGLIRTKSNKQYLVTLLKQAEKYFHIDYKILNALNFGVPQFRERVFFIGINKALDSTYINKTNFLGDWFPWPKDNRYYDSLNSTKWPTTSTFGSHLKKPEGIPIELCVENCLVPFNKMKNFANADEYFKLHRDLNDLSNIQEGETNRPSFKRLHRFRYSPTACYGNNEVHLHPYKNRRLSVREALRIQGVPDDYVLPKELSMTKKFKMIANGVPVPLASAVAHNLKLFISH